MFYFFFFLVGFMTEYDLYKIAEQVFNSDPSSKVVLKGSCDEKNNINYYSLSTVDSYKKILLKNICDVKELEKNLILQFKQMDEDIIYTLFGYCNETWNKINTKFVEEYEKRLENFLTNSEASSAQFAVSLHLSQPGSNNTEKETRSLKTTNQFIDRYDDRDNKKLKLD